MPGLTGLGAVSWSALSDMSVDDVLQPPPSSSSSDRETEQRD